MDWPEQLELECHKTHVGHTDVYGRMLKDRPAAALTTRCISLSNGRYGHPTQNRAISVREAARIQTFPPDFRFFGSLNSMARQVGNAVPVELARVCGLLMIDHFNRCGKTRAAQDGQILGQCRNGRHAWAASETPPSLENGSGSGSASGQVGFRRIRAVPEETELAPTWR